MGDAQAHACSLQQAGAQHISPLLKSESEGRPDAGIEERLKALAAKRKLSDLSVGPVLTWTNERMKAHMDRLLQIPGAPCRAPADMVNTTCRQT